jgi:transposase
VSHRNARLTFHGRATAAHRVRDQGRPQAHVAKEMGVSRQCIHRWVHRYDTEGPDGLHDRSSRPRSSPTHTSAPMSRNRSWTCANVTVAGPRRSVPSWA